MAGRRARVLLVTTGGTISMRRDGAGGLVPYNSGPTLLEQVPEIASLAEVTVLDLGNEDSSSIQPAFWQDIARAIYDRYREYDGFVVTHGTDTMVYTAAALSFFLQELGRPIVLTGAQVPLEQVGTDGRANLVNAVRVATSDLAEVCIVFGTLVIRGSRARKTSAFDLQAFHSGNAPPIGTLGLTLRISPEARRRAQNRRPLYQPSLCTQVARIPVWPGMDPAILRFLGQDHAGIVIEGFGVGTLPTGERSLLPAIHETVAAGVAVVVTTQCVVGSTALEVYEVGRRALEVGAIPAIDMTPEATQVKLMWALGQSRDLRLVESIMLKDHVGELTPPAWDDPTGGA